jgi:hypothetical protein
MRTFALLAASMLAGCFDDAGRPAPATALGQQASGSCLAPRPEAWAWIPEQRRRHQELSSDSLWLINTVRRRHADRLAGVRLEVGMTAADARLVFRLTGDEPIPAMRLGDGARAVPVIVEYGAPHSLREVEALRARVQHRVLALVPTLQGVGYDEGAGAIHLDVHAADEQAQASVLAQCDALAELYGLPVLIALNTGVVGLQETVGGSGPP